MAEKRIFDIQTEATIDDITENVYAWFDKKAQQGEAQEPSWKFDVYLLVKFLNNFATKFVPNVATVEGKCYWHGGDLFVCNVAYTGDWVPGNFTLTSVDELFARKDVLSALTTYAQNVASSIATPFDPTRNYAAGESCTYGGSAYIFTSNHNAGAWNEDDVVAFSTNSLYALKSRATTNPRFYWIKELFLPSTIPASSVSGIRAWCAYPYNDNTEWWTGIQLIAGNEFYNFYRIFDNQTDASSFATSIFDMANNNGRLLAFVDWDAIGGVGHKFELSRAMLTPDCNNVAYMPTLHEYEIEKEIELENTNDKEAIKVYHLTLAAGVPSSSTNRASSGFIRTYKNSKIVFQNLHNMYVGFEIYYYDVLGRYIKNDTTHWTNETIDPNNSFVLDCVEDGFVRFLFRIRYDNPITDEIIGKLENGIKAIAKEKIWQNGKKNSFDIFTDVIADSYYSQFADKVNNSATTKLFAMQTDTHYSYFNGYSSYTQIRQMRKALKLALVPTIVNLGDLCNGWCPKPSHCSDVMHAIWDYSKFGNAYIQLVGNHDDNSWWEHEYGANKPAGVITPEEWHDMAYSKTKDYGVYMPYGKRYGSYDDVPNKVRYIFLDTLDIDYTLLNADGTLKYDGQWKSAIRQEQLDFLCQALLTRRDFRIFILSHHPLHSNGGVVNSDLVRGILEAYKNKTTYTGTSTITDFEASVSVDFSGDGTMVNAKLVGCFNGHTHADAIVLENGINYVGTTCAFVPTDSQDRSSSDETMNAFDVVAITSTTCYLYRFGYGSDRSFVFG